MADYYTANRTLVNAGTKLAQGEYGGEVKCLKDSYVVPSGGIAVGSKIKGVPLPAGAIVIGIKLKYEDLSASGAVLDVGDGVDPDRYYNDLDVASANVKDDILIGGIGHKVGSLDSNGIEVDDKEIIMTVVTGPLNEAGATIKSLVFYV